MYWNLKAYKCMLMAYVLIHYNANIIYTGIYYNATIIY